MDSPIRIGTRRSRLALTQAHMVSDALTAKGFHTILCEFVTTGDAVTDRPLADIGGKGLFTKEIDRALLDGEVDIAVHSLKDMETQLPPGIALAAVLERADPADRLIGAVGLGLGDLPKGARLGTSAVRRRAALLTRRPDLDIVPLRGNVETRLNKWRAGEVDALILAQAGLDRLGYAENPSVRLSTEDFIPACGQGIVGITCRAGDGAMAEVLVRINHAASLAAATAERAMLAVLDGNCRTPIAAYAREVAGQGLVLTGALYARDGADSVHDSVAGTAADAETMGRDLGHALLGRASREVKEALRDTG